MNISTPDLCDNFPDLIRVLAPIFNNYGGHAAFGGPIRTIKCVEDNSLVKAQLNLPGKEHVLVVDGGGSLRCALLGDLLAAKAVENGWAGLIIHGCIRDVDEIYKMPLGVRALATVPLKSVRKGQGDLDVPVLFGGVTFCPGEFVYADNDGIVVSAERLI